MNKINNKRIAKNTIYLYIRTIIVMFISLYTSRMILKLLGEVDLGIYNLVGGIVSLMAFLQAAQIKSTSRFITYELGLGKDKEQLSRIYSICMSIHIIIIIAIIIIAETIGLYIINNFTNIPSDRLIAANVVYQLSLLTFAIHFLRNPLDSIIIAHEEMSVYAYMSIIEVILKLGLVLCIMNYTGDRLIIYALLILVISVILFISYLVFKNKRYNCYKYKFVWDTKMSISILNFSGWTLLGSSTNTLTQQGTSILFNKFVGLIANTAIGFSSQINAAVGSFVNSFSMAFNPQIIKLVADRKENELFKLINRTSKFSFSLCYIISLPIIFNMSFLLDFWLDSVPKYTVEFSQLILICSVIDSTTGVFNTTITASGKIRKYQIAISLSFLFDFLLSLSLLYFKCYPVLVFGSRILTRGFINMLIGFHYSRINVNFPISKYIKEVLLPISFTLCITIPFLFIHFNDNFHGVLLSSILCIIISLFCVVYIIMDKYERNTCFNILKDKIYGLKCIVNGES